MVADVESNGTPLGRFAPNVLTAAATGLSPAKEYWFNVLARDEAPIVADDSYFDDVDERRTRVNTAQSVTGADGSALVLNSNAPAAHSGAGTANPWLRAGI